MNKSILIIVLVIAIAGISGIQKDDGRAAATGSPGETTCNTSNCHTGNPVNAPGGSIAISAPTMPGWEYVPGQVYPISVTVERQGRILFGFGFEALRSTGANGGALSITNAVQTQIKSASVGGNIRTNVVHQLNGGASPNTHTFTFNWTAPVTQSGPVTFYTAGNATNSSGSASGDYIYNTSQIVTESTSSVQNNDGLNNSLTVYPNPSSGTFGIQFHLTNPSFVQISLIDLQGKTVAVITSSPLPTGNQLIYHTPDNSLPKGIYLLRLKVDNEEFIKRIAIV